MHEQVVNFNRKMEYTTEANRNAISLRDQRSEIKKYPVKGWGVGEGERGSKGDK